MSRGGGQQLMPLDCGVIPHVERRNTVTYSNHASLHQSWIWRRVAVRHAAAFCRGLLTRVTMRF